MILYHYIVFFYQFLNKMMLLTRVLVYFADNQQSRGKGVIRT